jgi:TonB-dependent SusC/RagA subfamily outer membrane receptor
MTNRETTPGPGGRSLSFSFHVIVLIIFLCSFKTASAQENSSDHTLFSYESQKKILQMVYNNIMYPSKAKENNLTGRFFVIVQMKKGGKVDQVRVNVTDKSISVPLLSFNEVVIVGYGLKNPAGTLNQKTEKTDLTLLTDEGVRVAKMLGSVKVPEWENGDLEFAISFSFQLKYPEEKTNLIKIGDNSFQVNPEPVFMLDGKEISKAQLNELHPNEIESISVLKDESATKVYGEKGKNGVIIITTKK